MINVAVFDFCGTFVPFESADEYIRFSTQHCLNKKKKRNDERFISFLKKTRILTLFNRFFNISLSKRILAKRAKGLTIEEAHDQAIKFYELKIKPALIKKTISLLEEYKRNKCYVVLVSAAYDEYLSLFASEYEFDYVISAKLGSKNGVLNGKVKEDCIGTIKKKKLLKFLNMKFGKGNYEIVFSVGDSKTDIPILDLASRKVVINKTHQDWIKPYYEEIIYGN